MFLNKEWRSKKVTPVPSSQVIAFENNSHEEPIKSEHVSWQKKYGELSDICGLVGKLGITELGKAINIHVNSNT